MFAELSGTLPKVVERPEGTLKIWTARKGMVCTQGRGRMELGHLEEFFSIMDEAIGERPGDVVAVHDLLEVESYEIRLHPRLSAWSAARSGKIRRTVIGVRSPLVSLAIRTVNLAVGGRFEVVEDAGALHGAARREWGNSTPRIATRS